MQTIIRSGVDSSSTSTAIDHQHSNASLTESGSNIERGSDLQLLPLVLEYISRTGDLQKEVTSLKEMVKAEQNKTKGFYQAIAKLSNASRIVIWILLIIPMLQLLGCTVVVYHLGIQEDLPSLLTWVLESVSVLSIIEMIALPIKFFTLENRINEMEKKAEERNE